MSYDPQSPSDRADHEPESGPGDWNGKLYVNRPMPTSGLFWIVTDEAEAHEVSFDATATFWTGANTYSRQGGEQGSWTDGEILGWTMSGEDAEEAADALEHAQ